MLSPALAPTDVAWAVPSHHLGTVVAIQRSARRAGVGAGKFSDTLPIRRAGDERR